MHLFNTQTVECIRSEYANSTSPWLLGFSGGKDSSALLKLLFTALVPLKHFSSPVTVLYCDTGVDIPPIRKLVTGTIRRIADEAKQHGLPVHTRIVKPLLRDRFFVKVVGRGYPPPTNKFRWCTDILRIDPVRRYLDRIPAEEFTILLAIRRGESIQRDKTISLHQLSDTHHFRQEGNSRAVIFSPIVDYSTEEIWATLIDNPFPKCINVSRLMALYRSASGECPIVRDPRGTPCGKGRFGCWTCTVVRRDRAFQGLIESQFPSLRPLLDFKQWLLSIRDDPAYRCPTRRNRSPGPGPFTLRTRRLILRKLLAAQTQAGVTLLSTEETGAIGRLWYSDSHSASYKET